MESVPVLMYHHVLPEGGFITTPVEIFRKQMEMLVEEGYRTLSLEEFYRFKKGELSVKKGVVITFDDGWRDNYYYAYPILKELNLRAIIFVVTEWVEKASQTYLPFRPLSHNLAKERIKEKPAEVVLNWKELEQMGDLMDIQSHTHSHRDFYFGKKYSWEEEFALSRQILKKRGFNPSALCWPRGNYSPELVEMGKNYFNSFWTTRRGINLPNSNLTEIRRIGIKNRVKWLSKRLKIYRHPLLGGFYSFIKRK